MNTTMNAAGPVKTTHKILVVEDEPDLLDLVVYNLRKEGFKPVRAETGAKALELARDEKPDLVLLDLMMPDMDGWEVYQQMKSSETMRDIPVIVVTAKAQSIDKVLGLHIAKVNDYITKPFGPSELLSSVLRVLQEVGIEAEEAQ